MSSPQKQETSTPPSSESVGRRRGDRRGGERRAADRRGAERLPGNGAKVVLMTKRGQIEGVLVNYSETGALVDADGHDLAGTRVQLGVQGPEGNWEHSGTVVWYSTVRGVAIAFDLQDPGLGSKAWS